MSLQDVITEADLDPQFVNIQILQKGDVFVSSPFKEADKALITSILLIAWIMIKPGLVT